MDYFSDLVAILRELWTCKLSTVVWLGLVNVSLLTSAEIASSMDQCPGLLQTGAHCNHQCTHELACKKHYALTNAGHALPSACPAAESWINNVMVVSEFAQSMIVQEAAKVVLVLLGCFGMLACYAQHLPQNLRLHHF